MQRWRIRFSRGEEIKYISHLDSMRLWERALRRAALPIAYSSGFNPHPRLVLAAPLAVGVTSETEIVDVYLTRPMAPALFRSAVIAQMPRGIQVIEVNPVYPSAPSLPSLVQWAEYRVDLESSLLKSEIETAIQSLLNSQSLPWQHKRDTGVHSYDLRALISDIKILYLQSGRVSFNMKLRCGNLGSGRPEQITLALGFSNSPLAIHRTRLIFSDNSDES